MAQVQCPNCGGYKVTTESSSQVYSAERKPYTGKGRRTQIIGMVILTFLVVLVCPLSVASSDPSALLILMGIGIVVMVVWWILMLKNLNRGYKESVGMIASLKCDLCGYKWTQDSRLPPPTVTVRADLIAKGEEELRAAAAKRQREAELYQAWRNQQDG